MEKTNLEYLHKKAIGIRVIATDVDGVLTNGAIVYDDNGTELKFFNVKDGLIIKHLRKNGIATGVITGRDSKVVRNRCNELHMDFHKHGIMDKKSTLIQLAAEMNITLNEIAYIGDDINDISTLGISGFSAAPADAPPYIQNKVDYVTNATGGNGVFREVADLILMAKGLLNKVIEENS